ncbi:MAG TPA: peptidase S10, partial [Sphingomicrobium sp.]|nr:peptidase S10 [Sphingomicrobium sp.]
MRHLTLLCAAAFLAVTPALAQSSPGGDKGKSVEDLHKDDLAKEAAGAWTGAPVEERAVSTHHSVNVSGRALRYTSTAGTVTIRDVSGKPQASIFYTADTLDGVPGSRRPITFF